jgi:hypothetical protein
MNSSNARRGPHRVSFYGERLLGEIPQIRPKRRQLARENAALTFIREIEQNFATAAQSMTKSFRDVRGGEKRSHFRRGRTEPRNRIEAAVAECPPPVAADLTAPLAGTR